MAEPRLSLSLQFADARHRAALPRHKVTRWIRAALSAPAQLVVRIVDEDEGRTLNRDYRGKDYATNVLTFAYDEGAPGTSPAAAEPPPIEADLVLCAPIVEREAREQGRSVEAHYAHLLVHGTLHAQGHDHEQPDEAERMEALESAILRRLGFADPYAPAPG
jgi:probable rRNA maturation factor